MNGTPFQCTPKPWFFKLQDVKSLRALGPLLLECGDWEANPLTLNLKTCGLKWRVSLRSFHTQNILRQLRLHHRLEQGNFRYIGSAKKKLLDELALLDQATENRYLSRPEKEKCLHLRGELGKMAKAGETLGGKNPDVYGSKKAIETPNSSREWLYGYNSNRRNNSIDRMLIGEELIEDSEKIKLEILRFYQGLYKEEEQWRPSAKFENLATISTTEKELLERAFEEEVLALINSCAPIKAGRSAYQHVKKCYLLVNEVENMDELAGIRGCGIVSFPTTYLGLPLGAKYKAAEVWNGVIEMVEKKLTFWQMQYLSMGGRLVLINRFLDIIPTYIMSLFPIPSKRYGQETASLCKRVVTAKYGKQNHCSTSTGTAPHGVGPWKHISKLRYDFFLDVLFSVGNGNLVSFWNEKWLIYQPLKISHPNLYRLAVNPYSTVAQNRAGTSWNLLLRRNLQDWELEEIFDLYKILEDRTINPWASDKLRWGSSSKGSYSVKAGYSKLSAQNEVNEHWPWKLIWRTKLPYKIMCFTWTAIREAILTQDNLCRRKFQLANRCFMCQHSSETVNHLLLHWSVASDLWNMFLSISGISWVLPRNVKETMESWNHWVVDRTIKKIWQMISACIFWMIGSWEHPLMYLSVKGKVVSDGDSFEESFRNKGYLNRGQYIGPGGGSGGSILLFLKSLHLGDSGIMSSIGGSSSSSGGGGGGGGRIHFHWSEIPTGDVYQPIATVNGSIYTRGGVGGELGGTGGSGTFSGKPCPKGLYGIFCAECPLGTFKNVTGSDRALCNSCPNDELPHRAVYISVRGGVTERPCPYKCVSERYHMPHCYTALEELIYTFGGPWLFVFLLLGLLILLALVLSVARMKFVGVDESPGPAPTQQGSQIDHSFPFLESLNEVLETNRVEESQSHVYRLYFLGPNTFSEPWHLSHTPPQQIKEVVYEGAFNTFVDEINTIAAYQWWEGAVHSILCILVYPLAWSWQQWRRRMKLQRLREFVRSEYDHACLRSCRSRALYEGLKVAATPDLMLAYVDFFLGGDEKRSDLPPSLHQRFPMSLLFGGDGSYMAPLSLNNDNVITSLMSQSIPPTTWYRLVAGLNAQLRLVRRGCLSTMFRPVLRWLDTFANPALRIYGIRVDVASFQATTDIYTQFGLLVCVIEEETGLLPFEDPDEGSRSEQLSCDSSIDGQNPAVYLRDESILRGDENSTVKRKFYGRILDIDSLKMLKEKRDLFYVLSFLIHNTKPVGHQDLVGLVISILLLGDFSLVLLTLLQLYSISLADVFLVLFVLPLGMLLPFPAGINALFSHGQRRSAGLARVYALWNITSLINVAFGTRIYITLNIHCNQGVVIMPIAKILEVTAQVSFVIMVAISGIVCSVLFILIISYARLKGLIGLFEFDDDGVNGGVLMVILVKKKQLKKAGPT
ncbi:putative transcription repressor MYB6-like [Capsicum annuum]|nr:putative transcription repressor MYB6-like [Capsicum annuum]